MAKPKMLLEGFFPWQRIKIFYIIFFIFAIQYTRMDIWQSSPHLYYELAYFMLGLWSGFLYSDYTIVVFLQVVLPNFRVNLRKKNFQSCSQFGTNSLGWRSIPFGYVIWFSKISPIFGFLGNNYSTKDQIFLITFLKFPQKVHEKPWILEA